MLKKARKAAILGLDWGSSSIRASVISRDDKKAHPVWNRKSIPGHDERYQKGAFSSALYLDDVGKVYTGEVIDEDRDPVPSKHFFTKSPRTGIDAIDVALNNLKADKLWNIVHDGMEAIVKAVFLEVEDHCSGKNPEKQPYYIDEIGLSYPAHWKSEERSKYERLLRKVASKESAWIQKAFDVSFHAESLASAHCLFWHRELIDNIISPELDSALVVFLDFGGYTMNGCMFDVQKGNDSHLSYHRVGETFSTFGGTQLWEQKVSDFCRQEVEKDRNVVLPPGQRASLLKQFHLEIKSFRTSEIEPMSLSSTNPYNQREKYSVFLEKELAEKFFRAGLEEPIKLAEKKIAEAFSLSSTRVRVVLSGGSGKNSVVQARLESACKSHDIPAPYCFYEGFDRDDSWNISKGAAFATANIKSVQEVIANGAAFGFQRSSSVAAKGSKRSKKPGSAWEEQIQVSFDSHGSRSCKKWYSGKMRVRIICDPFLQLHGSQKYLRFASCCDIVELPQPSKGYWQFNLRFECADDDARLIVERSYMGHDGDKIKYQMPILKLPLYYDPSYCCCLVKSDVDDEGYGLLVTEAGQIVACPKEPRLSDLQPGGGSHLENASDNRKRKRRATPEHVRGNLKRTSSFKPSGHLPELSMSDCLSRSKGAKAPSRYGASGSLRAPSDSVEETINVANSESGRSVLSSSPETSTPYQPSVGGKHMRSRHFWKQWFTIDPEDALREQDEQPVLLSP
ncbi:hypothetical protein CTAM01_16505 [Colletotrichum tamarilloi]|uniref:Hsp70-like protein n=1 Tax=Colletotrichum tamarilloi TaxID=1209934 RepID=A0ABQ9QI86_9PEZI|nr:uncharacterized protein CTAM01_16505 [Colletotrichum tamarilloi]KAK1471614.1 hypothetical protein CTAM01_16505 [Colletotrichum tamarilloi]